MPTRMTPIHLNPKKNSSSLTKCHLDSTKVAFMPSFSTIPFMNDSYLQDLELKFNLKKMPNKNPNSQRMIMNLNQALIDDAYILLETLEHFSIKDHFQPAQDWLKVNLFKVPLNQSAFIQEKCQKKNILLDPIFIENHQVSMQDLFYFFKCAFLDDLNRLEESLDSALKNIAFQRVLNIFEDYFQNFLKWAFHFQKNQSLELIPLPVLSAGMISIQEKKQSHHPIYSHDIAPNESHSFFNCPKHHTSIREMLFKSLGEGVCYWKIQDLPCLQIIYRHLSLDQLSRNIKYLKEQSSIDIDYVHQAQHFLYQAQILIHQKQWLQAKKLILQSLELTYIPKAFLLLGEVELLQGDLFKAQGTALKAMSLFGEWGPCYALMGDICMAQGDFSGAKTFYEQGLLQKYHPQRDSMLKKLARIEIINNQLSRAILYLQEALKFQPHDENLQKTIHRLKVKNSLSQHRFHKKRKDKNLKCQENSISFTKSVLMRRIQD